MDYWQRRAKLKLPADPAFASALAKGTSLLQATAVAGAVSSVADLLVAASPATQATAGQRPTGVAAANGLAELSFDGTDDCLSVPAHAGNRGSPRWGLALWLQPTTVSGTRTVLSFRAEAGASVSRMHLLQFGTSLIWDVYHSAFVIRRATIANFFALNTRVFLTAEFDGTQATDALKAIVTMNAAASTPVYADNSGTPGAMPSTLVQPTGTAQLGATTTAGSGGFLGRMGPLVLQAQPAASLSGGGIWTPAERVALMNNFRPT